MSENLLWTYLYITYAVLFLAKRAYADMATVWILEILSDKICLEFELKQQTLSKNSNNIKKQCSVLNIFSVESNKSTNRSGFSSLNHKLNTSKHGSFWIKFKTNSVVHIAFMSFYWNMCWTFLNSSPVTTAQSRPKVPSERGGLQIWWLAVNILNKLPVLVNYRHV